MPQGAWSNKRERQYEHIKESAKKRGKSTARAKEIAARTVNKERAEAGETKSSSSRRKSTTKRSTGAKKSTTKRSTGAKKSSTRKSSSKRS